MEVMKSFSSILHNQDRFGNILQAFAFVHSQFLYASMRFRFTETAPDKARLGAVNLLTCFQRLFELSYFITKIGKLYKVMNRQINRYLQLLLVERFHQVLIDTSFLRSGNGVAVASAGQQDDGAAGITVDRRRCSKAVHGRHTDIHDSE